MIQVPGLLEGKVALVAGGGGAGIGGATSKLLGAAGASVAVIDIDEKAASMVAAEMSGEGAHTLPIVADVRDMQQCDGIVEQVWRTFGTVDILVNVAGGMHGIAPWRDFVQWTESSWDAVMELNLRYVFVLSRAVILHMLDQGRGGAIVNISSISGAVSAPNHSAYGAAKAAVVNLTRTLAVEYGPRGIRVNAVAPGEVHTPRVVDTIDAAALRRVPLRRPARPEEVAYVVLFLASPLASYVSGQTIMVDGGASVAFPLDLPIVEIADGDED